MSPPVRLLKTVRLLETLEYLRTDVLSNNLPVSALLAWKSEISILYNTFWTFPIFKKGDSLQEILQRNLSVGLIFNQIGNTSKSSFDTYEKTSKNSGKL